MKKLFIIFFCLFSISIAQETLNESIVHDDLVRDYIIHIPSSYDNKIPIPIETKEVSDLAYVILYRKIE